MEGLKRDTGSGHPLADRRFDYARALLAEGDRTAAADLLAQALDLAPDWAAGWFALGEARLPEDRTGALDAFVRAATLDGDGHLGVELALAGVGAGTLPRAAAPAYVRAVFDEYAPRFEAHLTGALGYRAPALLRAALAAVSGSRRFGRALDLGCGTGLMGAVLRPSVDHLSGVDLSPAMIEQARAKGVYDALEVGDMLPTLAEVAPLDLAIAADVLPYVGDLRPVFAAVYAALMPGGLFAFTVQRSDDVSVRVGADRRFAHPPAHIRESAGAQGFAISWFQDASTRQDAGTDVPGLVVVLAKQ